MTRQEEIDQAAFRILDELIPDDVTFMTPEQTAQTWKEAMTRMAKWCDEYWALEIDKLREQVKNGFTRGGC